MPPVTVLYVHGLESGPGGTKARNLASAGFNLVATQMPCNHGAMLRDPWFPGVLLVGVALVAGLSWFGGPLGCVLGVGVAVYTRGPVVAHWVYRAFERSVAVQVNMLARHEVGAVVGSSFGGAVALALLQRGHWKGPTVLLCPAHNLIADRARRVRPVSLAGLDASRVVVVHGQQDTTVKPVDSRALVAGSGARLVEVQDDHRLTVHATPDNLRGWVEMACRGVALPGPLAGFDL